jgi:tetratricopeptide (TPR) repeat protein
MRSLVFTVLTCWILSAQDVPAPTAEPVAVPVVTLDVAPLAPPDLNSPYASPRDAARHRFQVTLAELQSGRNIKAGLQGFAEALALDRTYAAAAFNLGVIASIAEKWDDALSAFEEASRRDAGLDKLVAPQIERLRLIRSLEATPEGRRRRNYDAALYPVLAQLPKLQPAEAMAALAEVGKLDPKRWEAPALLAGLNGNGRGYDVAAKFLDIAVANATVPTVMQRLQKALEAAQRELRYTATRAAAEAAADRGEYAKAGELYENTWAVIPARASNGMEAASAWLLRDDTAHAATLLVRLRESGNSEFTTPAAAMLKELEPIEPAAKAAASDARDFFHDAGSADSVYISDLIPPVDKSGMEVLLRPLPALVSDPEPVVLLAALSANPAEVPQTAVLPDLAAPRLAGENPWRELSNLRNSPTAAESAPTQQERSRESADISNGARTRRQLQVITQPSGARIFIDESAEAICQSPCDIQTVAGNHTVRLSLSGYQEESRNVSLATGGTEVEVALKLVRGSIIVETPGPVALKVNGTAIANPSPVELSLLPGLYRIAADFGSGSREREVTIKPGTRLRLDLRPQGTK